MRSNKEENMIKKVSPPTTTHSTQPIEPKKGFSSELKNSISLTKDVVEKKIVGAGKPPLYSTHPPKTAKKISEIAENLIGKSRP